MEDIKQKFLEWVVGNMEYGYLYEDVTDDGDGIFQLTGEGEDVVDFIEQELDKARREYFSMGMEYFSLVDDSNIYQKKGWKLSEEKAERLQILDKMFNLLKDNK